MVYWLPYSSHTSHHSSVTPCLPWISYATQKSCKLAQKQPEEFHTFLWHFFQVENNFIAYRSSKVPARPDCIFEIHQVWQSGFSRVYSNSFCSCSFEPEILKIGQSSHKMYSNKILNFQESTTILNACPKKFGNLLNTQRMYLRVLRQIRGLFFDWEGAYYVFKGHLTRGIFLTEKGPNVYSMVFQQIRGIFLTEEWLIIYSRVIQHITGIFLTEEGPSI